MSFISCFKYLVLLVVFCCPFWAQADSDNVNVYNWAEYITEDALAQFEEETGIHVNYDLFDSSETLETVLLAGSSGYDVVFPGDSFFQRQAQVGALQKLNISKLDNLNHIAQHHMQRMKQYDKNNEYGVPYMWGTTGYAFNENALEDFFGENKPPVNSWAMMFEPVNVARMADCGVSFLNSPLEVFNATLNYLSYPLDTENAEHYVEVEELLLAIRPYIKYFNSSVYLQDLANGENCLSMAWNGDAFFAQYLADMADTGAKIKYIIPKEGANIWYDVMAIPVDAPNVDNAHAFINFILRPEVIGDISSWVWYANPNKDAYEYTSPVVRDAEGVYPNEEVYKRLYTSKFISNKLNIKRNNIWQRIIKYN